MQCVQCNHDGGSDVRLHIVTDYPLSPIARYQGASFCNEACLTAFVAARPGVLDRMHVATEPAGD